MLSNKPIYMLNLGKLHPERCEYVGKYIKVKEVFPGRFEIIKENLTSPCCQLGFGFCVDENFKNLDPDDHPYDCNCDECLAGGITHFSWKDVEFKLDENLIFASSIESLRESLKFIGFTDWTLLDA